MSTQYYLAIFAYLFSIYSAYCHCHRTETSSSPDHADNRLAWSISSILCGIIATFSFGMGILVWPALLYFSYMWRAPARYISLVVLSCVFCLTLFLLLPGGKTIEDALLFSLNTTLSFLFHLAGGPIYYLLKSYRFFDAAHIRQIASAISVIATSAGILLLFRLLIKRRTLSIFSTLCCALVLVGLGTAALISFTRNPFFLDVWVDRYQIWGTLFWLGFLPLCYIELGALQKNIYVQKTFLVFLFIFPLTALPSQLDMGARLAEYKIRVQQSLLTYQAGIPDKRSAEEALHWNWENKLSPFFSVLNYLKVQKKNIYYGSLPDALGKNIDDFKIQEYTPVLSLRINATDNIARADLLNLKAIATSGTFVSFDAPAGSNIVARQLKAEVVTSGRWTQVLTTNEAGIINGLGIVINHSRLPRSQLKYINADYNLFAVVRNDGAKKVRFYFFNDDDISSVQSSDEVDIGSP